MIAQARRDMTADTCKNATQGVKLAEVFVQD